MDINYNWWEVERLGKEILVEVMGRVVVDVDVLFFFFLDIFVSGMVYLVIVFNFLNW